MKPTMFYRPAAADTDEARRIDNEAGSWEWIVVDLDTNEAPTGWQDAPIKAASIDLKKSRKVKAETEPDADGNGN